MVTHSTGDGGGRARSAALRELHAQLKSERVRLTAAGYLPVVGEMLFRHGETRIEAELPGTTKSASG